MMRVAICTPDVAPGDAVSNDVIGMDLAFDAYDCETRIFAQNIYISRPEVLDFEKIGSFLQDSRDLIIYHHSVGWDAGLSLLRRINCRRVIKYHNVTPSRFFEGLADNYVVACRKGREQLSDLRKLGADLYLADSAYNLDELLVEGRTGFRYAVIPPFHCVDRLQTIEADSVVVNRFGNGGAENLLMVGRIVPNKGYSYLIEVFHAYRSQYNSKCRLLLAGREDPTLSVYTQALHRQVSELGLEESVFFLGAISDAALKACYHVADAFVITSLHEGFCVPLVEAMSMRVPIVAYSSGAIRETVGNAGLVWKDRDPELLAYSLDLLMRDEQIRMALSETGLRRYRRRFSNKKIREMLLGVLEDAKLIG
jgi:glycosyltransferase involved in cell wall biosynthesis